MRADAWVRLAAVAAMMALAGIAGCGEESGGDGNRVVTDCFDASDDPQPTRAELERFATVSIPAALAPWEHAQMRGNRQNALRHLIATSPDFHTS